MRTPVSYTHLDVYKRQLQFHTGAAGAVGAVDLHGLEAAAGVATKRDSAALWFARGSLLASIQPTPVPEGGPVEESYRQALLAEPGHIPALLRLQLRALATDRTALQHSPLSRFVTSGLQAQFASKKGSPSQPWWGIKLAVTEESDANEPAAALKTYRELLSLIHI